MPHTKTSLPSREDSSTKSSFQSKPRNVTGVGADRPPRHKPPWQSPTRRLSSAQPDHAPLIVIPEFGFSPWPSL